MILEKIKIIGLIWITVIIYVSVVLCVILDLWSGIRKSKKKGNFCSSFGLRKTVDKLSKYFNMMLILSIVDALQIVAIAYMQMKLPQFPFLTLLAAIFVAFIEVKSVYEKTEKKEQAKIKDTAKLAGRILTDKDVKTIVSAVTSYMSDRDNDRDNDIDADALRGSGINLNEWEKK